MNNVLYPDELIRSVLLELAYNKGILSFDNLWEFTQTLIDLNDEKLRSFVFRNLMMCRDILLFNADQESMKDIDLNNIDQASYSLRLSEDKLWQILTGYTKKESPIGASAFQLLLEIGKSKAVGINTKQLADTTSQDPRSITGRIKKIEHLVTGKQVIYKGHVVKLLKLNKYSNESTRDGNYVNIREHLEAIVNVVKNSKNGIRQIMDLKREFKFDQSKRTSKSFITAISWLDEKQYLKKVYVVSPNNPSLKIRCVKYIRDYTPTDKVNNNFDYESDSSEEEDQQANEKNEDDIDLEGLNASLLLQDDTLMVEDSISPKQGQEYLLNRFFPIQNQTYELTNQSGTTGVSTMEVVKKVTGKDYQRAFAKSSEHYIETIGKQKKKVLGEALVRVYDFEGKKKFFRLFTEKNFGKLTGSKFESHSNSKLSKSNKQESLEKLNKKCFAPLNNTLRFISSDGEETFFWNGERNAPDNPNAKQRGRKRKLAVTGMDTSVQQSSGKTNERNKKSDNSGSHSKVVDEKSSNIKITDDFTPEVKYSPSLFSAAGFSAKSLRSLKRQQAILEVLKRLGGLSFMRDQLFETISRYMSSSTLIDKKTIRGDVDLMVQGEKLHITVDPESSRRIVYLPEIDQKEISDYILREKDQKKIYSEHTVHNTDIYFFDQTEKDRFHRGAKSAARVRSFQNSLKSSSSAKVSSKKKASSSKEESTNNLYDHKKSSAGKQSKAKKVNIKDSDVNLAEGTDHWENIKFRLSKKSGIHALIICVVITKSIKNEILWNHISRLFPSNSIENLKRQWNVCRVRMGYNGWKAHVDKWKKILVQAIKEDSVTLEDVEKLLLGKLVALWLKNDEFEGKPVVLYKNNVCNRKRYTFVGNLHSNEAHVGLSMSSMVQRESSSLKKLYTLNPNKSHESITNSSSSSENAVKSVIRSILFDDADISKNEVEVIDQVSKESFDKIIMDMAKEKQLVFKGSKLASTNAIKDTLGQRSDVKSFEAVTKYCGNMMEMLSANNGVIIAQEIIDYSSWVIIDLLTRRMIQMDVVPIERNIKPLNYTTRRFDVTALTPPLIISSTNSSTNLWKNLNVPIPRGKPFSRLWINGNGEIRSTVWKCLVSIIVNEILFNPGITVNKLMNRCNSIVCEGEVVDICNWLTQKGLIRDTLYNGYMVDDCWYMLLS